MTFEKTREKWQNLSTQNKSRKKEGGQNVQKMRNVIEKEERNSKRMEMEFGGGRRKGKLIREIKKPETTSKVVEIVRKLEEKKEANPEKKVGRWKERGR